MMPLVPSLCLIECASKAMIWHIKSCKTLKSLRYIVKCLQKGLKAEGTKTEDPHVRDTPVSVKLLTPIFFSTSRIGRDLFFSSNAPAALIFDHHLHDNAFSRTQRSRFLLQEVCHTTLTVQATICPPENDPPGPQTHLRLYHPTCLSAHSAAIPVQRHSFYRQYGTREPRARKCQVHLRTLEENARHICRCL